MSEFQTERAAQEGRPLTIKVGTHEFRINPETPAGAVYALVAANEKGGSSSVIAMFDYLADVVVEEQREELWALLTRRRRSEGPTVTMAEMAAGMQEAVQALSGSPFSRSSGSPPLPSMGGEKSPAPAGSEGSTSTEPRIVRL